MSRTIEITPTWEGLLPAMLAILSDSESVEHVTAIQQELERMAKAADLWNARVRAEGARAGEAILEHTSYIGDGVYASVENGMIGLRANSHRAPASIYLEQEVFAALAQFAKERMKW